AGAGAHAGGARRRPARARLGRPAAKEAEVVGAPLAVSGPAGSALLSLRTGELKRQLRLRGLDTSTCFDRECLLEKGSRAGLLPPDAKLTLGGAAGAAAPASSTASARAQARARARAQRRALRSGPPPAPVNVSLRRVPAQGQYLPSGLFTDGERVALPLWSEAEPEAEPLWFVLDTAIRRTALSKSNAARLGVSDGLGVARGLRFAGEPVGDLSVQVVPDGSAVLGDGVSGLL
ncbi:unnamed protein product, partial [Prorocentrum cordatum]